ncbi:MAG: MoaD/ThiS family protein [Deltaproteobacteria bacterium]
MKVTIKPVAALRKFLPEGVTDQVELELPEGATAADAAAALGIPAGHAGVAFLDNQKADLDTVLQDGQVVGLIPPLGGG